MQGGLTWVCVRARAVLCVQLLSRCRHRHAHGEARQRPNSFCNLSPGKYDLTVWRWMFCLDTSLGWMNKFVKGLVQVAVGAERCHMGLVLLWPGSSGLIIKTIGSLPCSMCCHSGSHTLGEALGEEHRLLPSMAFISREKHRNHFSRLLPRTEESLSGSCIVTCPRWIWHLLSPDSGKSLVCPALLGSWISTRSRMWKHGPDPIARISISWGNVLCDSHRN